MTENEASQSEPPPAKRLKLDDTSETAGTSLNCAFLHFCDDLLLEIFSYVEHKDLLALSQCCQRLHRVAFDRTLWNTVELRSTTLMAEELQKYVKFFLPTTRFLASKGPWEQRISENEDENQLVLSSAIRVTVTGELLENIAKAAPNLTTLIFENHIIDSKDLVWDKVPRNLECLSLKTCHLIKFNPSENSIDNNSNNSFFFKIDKFLPHLKSLDLSYCCWFESHSLLALSKCKQLQELRLAGCMLPDLVPYVSLGTRFGFKALTVVDLRWTWVSDREVSCLNKTPTLQELYLESPPGLRGPSMITDMAITAFGATLEGWREMGFIVVIMPQFQGFMPSPLRVVQMSKFVGVTDNSLRHCASCLKGLQRLNVRGTSCSQEGLLKFRTQRPDVAIECDYDLQVGPDSSSCAENI